MILKKGVTLPFVWIAFLILSHYLFKCVRKQRSAGRVFSDLPCSCPFLPLPFGLVKLNKSPPEQRPKDCEFLLLLLCVSTYLCPSATANSSIDSRCLDALVEFAIDYDCFLSEFLLLQTTNAQSHSRTDGMIKRL